MRNRAWLFAGLFAAVAAGVATALLIRGPATPELRSGTALPEPREIPAFSLVDAHGRPFDRAALENRWTLLFSGFTNCPDICPTTLALLASLRERLPGNEIRFVFLTVDPERDTPEVVARYLAHFGGEFTGVTGSPAEIERLTRALGLAQVRNPGTGGNYTVDHSAALVLIDPRARVAGYFTAPHDQDELAADLAPLVRQEGSVTRE
jgi:protein SCO1